MSVAAPEAGGAARPAAARAVASSPPVSTRAARPLAGLAGTVAIHALALVALSAAAVGGGARAGDPAASGAPAAPAVAVRLVPMATGAASAAAPTVASAPRAAQARSPAPARPLPVPLPSAPAHPAAAAAVAASTAIGASPGPGGDHDRPSGLLAAAPAVDPPAPLVEDSADFREAWQLDELAEFLHPPARLAELLETMELPLHAGIAVWIDARGVIARIDLAGFADEAAADAVARAMREATFLPARVGAVTVPSVKRFEVGLAMPGRRADLAPPVPARVAAEAAVDAAARDTATR